MDRQTIEAAAARLDEAEKTRAQVKQFSLQYPGMTVEDAYSIQQAWIDRKLRAGRVVKGHKIGLTSRVMQRAVNVHEPDYGVLLDDMFCDPDDAIDSARFIAPRFEAELAFVLRCGLSGPNCSMLDVMKATECVLPAVEILDARIERIDWETGAQRTVLDTISDNAANAALVLGKAPIPRRKLDDLRWIPTLCYRNAQIEETGVSAAVLGHPAVAVAWLANKLTSLGASLAPGDIVLSGSFIRSVEIQRGDVFHVDFGDAGTLACRFK